MMLKQTALALALLSAGAAVADDIDLSRPGTLGTPSGRYVFGQVSKFSKDQYMLDTTTGRLWNVVETFDDNGKHSHYTLAPVWYRVEGDAGIASTPDKPVKK